MSKVEWKKVRLGDVCKIISGSTPLTNVEKFWNGNNYWITPAELNGETIVVKDTLRKISDSAVIKSSLRLLPIGTVLLSSRAPIGKVAIAGVDMYCNQGFKNLTCSNKIFNKYLFWFLKGKTTYLNSLGHGATFKEISKTIVEQIEIPLPPLDHQRHIAATLDKANELITLRKKQLAELNTLAEAVFYDMFGYLKGKLEPLSKYCILNPKKSEINDLDKSTKVSFVPMAYVTQDGEVNLSENRTLEQVWNGFTYFKENDVAFAKITPCMENGKGAIMRNLINGIGFGTTEFHILRPIKNKSTPEWIYHLIIQKKFREEAEKNMTGSAGQKRVPTAFFNNYNVILPPLPLQIRFATIIEKIEAQKAQVRNALQESEDLFQRLMQDMFQP